MEEMGEINLNLVLEKEKNEKGVFEYLIKSAELVDKSGKHLLKEGTETVFTEDPCHIPTSKGPCRNHQVAAGSFRFVVTEASPGCGWVWDGRRWVWVCT